MNGACHQGDGFDMDKDFLAIFNAIKADGANADYTKRGIDPLYSVGAGARIVVIGQAQARWRKRRASPGTTSQESVCAIGWVFLARRFMILSGWRFSPWTFIFRDMAGRAIYRRARDSPSSGILHSWRSCPMFGSLCLWAHMPSAGTCISRIRTALQPWCAIMMPISAGDSSLWCIRRRATSYG